MRTLIALLSPALLLACGPTPEALAPGDVELPWTIPPAGCEAAGVDTIEVTLAGSQGRFSEQRPCDDGALSLAEVPFGRYTLSMRGLAQGRPVHEAQQTLLVVRPDLATVAPTTVLTALPASVALSWRFADDKRCEERAVETFLIGLYDPAGALIASTDVPCDAATHTLSELPAGSWTIGLTALPSGPATSAPVILKRGQRASLALSLD
jgi:hypothetical protein